MISTRALWTAGLWVAFGAASQASAQTFPVVTGTTEIQIGVSGITLPRDSGGLWSLNPELRIGFFLQPGFELQAEGNFRAWPGGAVSGRSYGGGGNLVWYPNLGPQSRNLYLLGGASGVLSEPPGQDEDTELDVTGRGGVGYKAPIAFPWLAGAHLSVEYRGEVIVTRDRAFVSGAAIGISFFR